MPQYTSMCGDKISLDKQADECASFVYLYLLHWTQIQRGIGIFNFNGTVDDEALVCRESLKFH